MVGTVRRGEEAVGAGGRPDRRKKGRRGLQPEARRGPGQLDTSIATPTGVEAGLGLSVGGDGGQQEKAGDQGLADDACRIHGGTCLSFGRSLPGYRPDPPPL